MKTSPEEGWRLEEDIKLIDFDPNKLERKIWIGLCLSKEEKVEVTTFLQNNKDVFAWLPSDMHGINPQIMCHMLHVNIACKPVAQKRQNFASEQIAIIKAKIEQVFYSEWLVNVVLVPKDQGMPKRLFVAKD